MAHPQHRIHGDSSRQSDPPLVAPYFLHNYIGLNEEEHVLSLTRLHLHRNSQADDEDDFLIHLLLFYKFLAFP